MNEFTFFLRAKKCRKREGGGRWKKKKARMRKLERFSRDE